MRKDAPVCRISEITFHLILSGFTASALQDTTKSYQHWDYLIGSPQMIQLPIISALASSSSESISAKLSAVFNSSVACCWWATLSCGRFIPVTESAVSRGLCLACSVSNCQLSDPVRLRVHDASVLLGGLVSAADGFRISRTCHTHCLRNMSNLHKGCAASAATSYATKTSTTCDTTREIIQYEGV